MNNLFAPQDAYSQYKLDVFFRDILYVYGNESRENYYKGFIAIVGGYKDLLNEMSKDSKYLMDKVELGAISSLDQMSTHDVAFGGDQFYNMCWSVPKALQYVKNKSISPVNLDVLELAEVCELYNKDIDRNHLIYASSNDDPLIIAYCEYIGQPYFVIDGKHRIMAKLLKGNKNIKAYLLNPKDHIESMTGSLYITLYKIHYNIILMIKYMDGEISRSEVDSKMMIF